MLIAIDRIREGANPRKIKPTPDEDAWLESSMRAQGLLQPILLKPDGADYLVLAGARRLKAAKAIGWTDIEALVTDMSGAWAEAAALTENIQRLPLHPLDEWRGMRALIAAGMPLPQAAQAVGMTDRRARRLEMLGGLHPAIQALIEEYDSLPSEHELRIIANAPPDVQAAAVNGNAVQRGHAGDEVDWRAVTRACRTDRLSRARALFDHDAMAWDVDWLAQPGSDDEYTTTDRETFMRLQTAALQAVADTFIAKRRRAEVVLADGWRTDLPKGFDLYSSSPDAPKSLKKTEALFIQLMSDGRVRFQVATDTKAATAAARAILDPPAPDGDGEGDDASDVADDTPEPEPEKAVLTAAGHDLVNAAKTQALHETLHDGISGITPQRLIALLILAFAADNVSVSCAGGYEEKRFQDLAARILLPGGGVEDLSMALAGKLLARVLSCGASRGVYGCHRSGAAAEWIGAAIGADASLPRFDTAEFLAQVKGDAIRAAAEYAGLKSTGTVKAVREALTGRAPGWRPDAAAFGAPAPVLKGG